MENQGKTNKQIRDSKVATGMAIALILWIVGYVVIFS